MKKLIAKIDSFFKITERGSTFTKEIIGGVIIFLAMVYILPVNVGMLGSIEGIDKGSIFFATAVSAGVATILMGILANYPIALASGMGLNALMTYTVCGALGYSYSEALAIIFVSGIIFIVISVSGIRKKVINAIPRDLKFAIGAGIGGFIALVGLSNAKVIVGSADGQIIGFGTFSPAFLLAIIGIILVFIFYSIKPTKNFAVIIAILLTTGLGLILNACGVEGMPRMDTSAQLKTDGVFAFADGFGVFKKPETYLVLFTFVFIDFFDTAGSLVAAGTSAGLVNTETGELIGDGKAFLSDAIGTVVGATLGTSTVTSFVESTTGVQQGARTGFCAVVTGILFLLSLLVFPIFSVIADSYATTTMALVFVGAMMFGNLKNINWEDNVSVISSFITVFFIVFCYSMSEGLALGFIFYVLMKIFSGRAKEVNLVMYILSGLFICNFIIKFAFIQ